jgi:adenosylhomocysteine nucleosidase
MNNQIPAIFGALDDEIRVIRSTMDVDERIHLKPSLIIRGQLNNKACILVRSGVGKNAMKSAVDYCLANYDISSCLNVGYAGGTTPYMNPGDLLIATTVVDAEKQVSFIPQNFLIDKAEAVCKALDIKAMRGGLATMDEVISTPHEKAFIGTEHEVLALDMESSAFMEQCQEKKVPCIVVRAILDPLDTVLPDMGDVLSENGKISAGQIATHLVNKPKDILSLPKIEYCAIKARESITSFVNAWINSL